MSPSTWIQALSRLPATSDRPITLSGGEPTQYPDFYKIVDSLPDGKCDLLTNCMFNLQEFTSHVSPSKFKRNAPYASIRISYHPGYHDPFDLIKRVSYLQHKAYDVGIWAVDYPPYSSHIRELQKMAQKMYKIDFRLKEFLGEYKGQFLGTYQYVGSTNADKVASCQCRTSELLIGPSGHIYRCHRDLYANQNMIAHMLDTDVGDQLGKWIPCTKYGECNPCDVKVKFDRYQVPGHCAVEVKDVTNAN
jgi:hypothetical protein